MLGDKTGGLGRVPNRQLPAAEEPPRGLRCRRCGSLVSDAREHERETGHNSFEPTVTGPSRGVMSR